MPRTNGRDLRIKRGASIIAVLNTKTINVNNTPVPVTGDTDNAFVKLLDRPGTRQITADCSGYTEDDTLRDQAMFDTVQMKDHTLEWLSSDGEGTVIYAVELDLFLASFSETGGSDGGLEFTCSLQSSGGWTKTVPAQ